MSQPWRADCSKGRTCKYLRRRKHVHAVPPHEEKDTNKPKKCSVGKEKQTKVKHKPSILHKMLRAKVGLTKDWAGNYAATTRPKACLPVRSFSHRRSYSSYPGVSKTLTGPTGLMFTRTASWGGDVVEASPQCTDGAPIAESGLAAPRRTPRLVLLPANDLSFPVAVSPDPIIAAAAAGTAAEAIFSSCRKLGVYSNTNSLGSAL